MFRCLWLGLTVLVAASAGMAAAQEQVAPEEEAASEEVALLTPDELEALVAPIAFYPDEVLAVTLPAATYPLDIVEASRFLGKQETGAQPSTDWDPSVLALLNYPVVLNMMNEDLDWTTSVGEAVINQQADVIDAIQQVRRSAYAGGHLKSDDKTSVSYENDVIEIASADPNVVYVPVYQPVAEPAPQPATEQLPAEAATEPSSTDVTTTTNVYYPPANMTYSEPYTPYYDDTATFWTGALVGGLTMGFLMNWDDDDIDIDFDEGDFDDWSPGRGDVNIDGDVNIGDDIDIGNGVQVGNGDSWRKMREQRTGGEQASQLKSTRSTKKAAAQPVSSLQKKPKKSQSAAAGANLKKKPTQTAKPSQVKKPQKSVSKQQPKQKAGALGNVERGQDTVKASKRGAASQQKVIQQTPRKQQAAPAMKQRPPAANAKPRQSNQSAFGSMNSGKKTQQFSKRGAGSSQKVRPRR